MSDVSGYHYYIDNIILFIPCSFLLMTATQSVWKSVVIGIVISLLIESLQALTGFGVFHMDDLTANGIGCIIGVAIAAPFLIQRKTRMYAKLRKGMRAR